MRRGAEENIWAYKKKLKGGWRKLVSRLFAKFYLGNKTKDGGTCSTRGRDKTFIQHCSLTQHGKESVYTMSQKDAVCKYVDWVDLAQVTVQTLAAVNATTSLRVPQKRE
jgi:hypothetical protein